MDDIRNLSLNDITVNGKPLVEPGPESTAEPAPQEPVQNPVQDNVQNNVQENVQEPAQGEVDWSKATIKFNTPSFKDDFIKGVVEYYEKTGDLTPYLQAKTTDFNGMSDEEIMRRSLREQYPDISEKAFDKLYRKEVVDRYKLDVDEYGEDETELGRELLKAEASKARQKYIEWQSGFKAPDQGPAPQEQEQLTAAMQQFEQTVKSNPVTNQILSDKRIGIRVGDSEFNYELQDANSLVDMTLDNNKFFQQFASGEGQLDFGKWYKTVAYSQNPELFEKALINYGRTLGREEVTKEIKNPSSLAASAPPSEESTDFATGLLNAFATRGIKK